jgi:hypothetical protein
MCFVFAKVCADALGGAGFESGDDEVESVSANLASKCGRATHIALHEA